MPPTLALRPPSRDQFFDGMKRAARRGASLVDRSRLGRRLIASVLAARAARHGAPEVLLARGDTLRREGPLRSTISFYRLLVAVSKGDLTRVGSLLLHVSALPAREDEMWAVFSLAGLDVDGLALDGDRELLVRRAAGPVEREIAATGSSRLFDWLIRNDVYRLDDEDFRHAIDRLIGESITRRRSAAAFGASGELLAARRSMTQTLAGIGHELTQPIFATGPTLRDEVIGRFESDPSSMEFGTFGACADLARSSLRAGLDIESCDEATLIVVDADRRVRARIGRYVRGQATTVYSDGVLSRWHGAFDVVSGAVDGTPCPVPSDIDRHLAERFGPAWEAPKLFYDDVFDSPNATYDDSLRALFDVYRRVRDSFASGERFVASESSRQLRDRFGIDFTTYVPQPVHHKVLSIPLRDRPVHGSVTTVIAGAFERLDAATIKDLHRVASDDRVLVAAVRDTPGSDDGVHRMTTVKTLRSIDHVVLYTSTADLISQLDDVDPDELLIRSDAGLRRDDICRPGLSVATVGDEENET